MGLLDLALGKENPVASYVDANKNAIHGAFSGLGTGQNISQGLSNAAQGAQTGAQADSAYAFALKDQQSRLDQIQYEQTLQQNALQLAAQGRNATADWLEKSPNPQVSALAGPVRNGTLSGADALTMVMKPGQTVQPGEGILPNPMAYGGGAAQPANTNPPTPTLAPPPQVNPADPTVSDRAQELTNYMSSPSQGGTGSPTAPVLAPTALSLPTGAQGAPAPSGGPQQPYVPIPTADPMKMNVPQRQAAAAAQGLKPGDPGYANFILTGRLPNNATETWRAATPADLQANGIAPGDQNVYQVSAMGQIRQVPGAVSNGSNGPALGTTGESTIDPTADGYSSKIVGGVGLTQAAIDQRALNYLTSGGTPPVGRTGPAGAQSAAISNRMAEIDPSGNLAANKSQLKSLTQSLATQQKYLDTTQRSIQNAEAGFQHVVTTFKDKGINTSQYPTINAMENAAKAQLSPGDISAFKAGLQEVANEYTQVFSRGGQVTDAVRSRAGDIVNGNLSIADLGKVLTELQAQGDIVVKGAQDQVKQIGSQINGIATGAPPDTSAAPSQYQEGQTATNPSTGAKVVYQGGQWVPVNG